MHASLYTGAVYFTLANIDPALRSKLDVINLVALFKSVLLVKYSLNDILKPFIDDLKKLCAVRYYIIIIISTMYLNCIYSRKACK